MSATFRKVCKYQQHSPKFKVSVGYVCRFSNRADNAYLLAKIGALIYSKSLFWNCGMFLTQYINHDGERFSVAWCVIHGTTGACSFFHHFVLSILQHVVVSTTWFGKEPVDAGVGTVFYNTSSNIFYQPEVNFNAWRCCLSTSTMMGNVSV